MWKPLAAAFALAAAVAACGPSRAAGVVTVPPPASYRSVQQVTYYTPAQTRTAEHSLGYTVVDPVGAVRRSARLPLAQVIVTELIGRKSIHYIFGDLGRQWVMVMETPDSATPFTYDPGARAVDFASRGRGISVTTNLSTATLNRIVQRLGGPRDAIPSH